MIEYILTTSQKLYIQISNNFPAINALVTQDYWMPWINILVLFGKYSNENHITWINNT